MKYLLNQTGHFFFNYLNQVNLLVFM